MSTASIRTLTLSCFCLMIVASAGSQTVSAEQITVRTAHYDLDVDGWDGAKAETLLEALHARLKTFFRSEPSQRLRVKVFSTRKACANALLKDGAQGAENFERRKLAGLYEPHNGIAYIVVSTRDLITRMTILHECTHQFYFLAKAPKQCPLSWYYIEGLATHFATHRWDGQHIEIGAMPLVEIEGSTDAMAAFSANHHLSIKELGVSSLEPEKAGFSYPEAWALISFFIDRYPNRYAVWADALDNGSAPDKAWELAFSDVDEHLLTKDYLFWLKIHRSKWDCNGNWDSDNDCSLKGTGTAERVGAAIYRESLKNLSAHVSSNGHVGTRGLIFGCKSAQDFSEIAFDPSGDVYLAKRESGTWSASEPILGAHAANIQNFVMSARTDGDFVEVSVDGKTIGRFRAARDGKFGLFTGEGTVDFSNIQTVASESSGGDW